MFKITLIIISLIVSVTVQAAGNGWVSSWAQGTTEYQVHEKGSSILYFGCNPEENTFVQYTDATGKSASSHDTSVAVYAHVDNGKPLLANDTFSDAGSAQFTLLWRQLRQGKSVTVSAQGMQSTTFKLSNAASVLPALEASDCRVMQ